MMELARTQKNVKALLSRVMAKAKILGFMDLPGRPTSPSERQAFGGFETGQAE